MINVAALRPSDIERLGDTKLSEDEKNAILTSVRLMLEEVPDDGGADADRIYMAAQMLDMAQVWDQVEAKSLAQALLTSPAAGRTAFLEGLPHEYAKEVAFQILTGQQVETYDVEPSEVQIVGARHGYRWLLLPTEIEARRHGYGFVALDKESRSYLSTGIVAQSRSVGSLKLPDDERLKPRARSARTPLAEG